MADPASFDKPIDLSLPVVKTASPEKPRLSSAPTEAPSEAASTRVSEIQARVRETLGDVTEVHYTPIKALNTFSTEWKIKARLTKKHPLKSWKNAKTSGVLLNIELMDSIGTQITSTFFNDLAKKWDTELVEGKVYTFANGSVKIAN